MENSNKIRVAVLYGGRSGEHEISLVSATNVIQNLDREKFEVVPIGIDKQGGWFLGDDVFKKELNDSPVLRLQCEKERKLFAPTLIGQALNDDTKALAEKNQHGNMLNGRMFDVVFPVIHGTLCEDGTVQGMLELADLPYVGCGVLSSAIGMDKDVSKRLVQAAGIAVAPFVSIKRGMWTKDPLYFCELIQQELHYPVFVKPSSGGSSVGITKVKEPSQLAAAITDAFKYDTKVIVEQGIDAREIELAVLESLDEGSDPLISIPGEITPSSNHEFYSYASKYLDEHGAALSIPADISKELASNVRAVAKKIFQVLECEGMARIDLFVERGTNRIYFNEINSIPGFTKISMYPKLMEATGIPYTELLTHLVSLATKRHARNSMLSREYVAE